MARLMLFNKPFKVLSQFTDTSDRSTLADYIDSPSLYPAGRLDYDSEGLLLLTDDGAMQARISDPRHKLKKHYWAQVEGVPDDEDLEALRTGIDLKDGPTRPAEASIINAPDLWTRQPPIRARPSQPTSWLALAITEGRNRQVRRMTAAIGYPTLRLVRHRIGDWSLDQMQPGEYREINISLPRAKPKPWGGRRASKRRL